jgi:hypothetical protein
MEISPISGIRALPPVKAKALELGPAEVVDIENYARIGDETYSPGGGKSASGAEEDAPEEELEQTEEEQQGTGYTTRAVSRVPGPKVNFFA